MKYKRDSYNNTSLTLAAAFADKQTLVFLTEELGMQNQINLTGYSGRNIFLRAAERKDINTIRYIDSLNPDLKYSRDNDNNTALNLAAYKSNKEMVQLFIEEYNFNVNHTGYLDRNIFLL